MSNNIERNVMASVAVIYTARKFLSPLALQWYALAISFAGLAMFVSLPHVAQNFQAVASGGMASIMTFALTAVVSTTIVVQLWLVLGSAAVISLFFRIARSFSAARTVRASA